MAQESKDTKKSKVELESISWEDIEKNYNDILKSGAPIWRKNIEGQFVTIPPSRIELYLGGKKIEGIKFFMEKGWRTRLEEKVIVIDQKQDSAQGKDKPVISPPKDARFDEQAKAYRQMPLKNRQVSLTTDIEEMNKKVELYEKIDMNVINEVVGILSNVWHINKISMQEHKTSTENPSITDLPDDYLDKLVQKTNILVDSIVSLLGKDKFKFSDLRGIESVSTGSSTMDHINRVVLRFIPYCIYYNEFFKSGNIAKIRAKFDEKFMQYYRKKDLGLEMIFKNGMRRLSNKELHDYSLGALLHDIGKFSTVDYQEKNDRAEMIKIKSHAPYSYNMIVKTKRFSMDAAYMALLHHEYYGDSLGYNFTVQLFPKLSSKYSDSHITNYYITYDITDLKEGRAIAFFPAKALEIVDVFDMLTGKEKESGDIVRGVEDALKLIMDEYIYKYLRVDPILFYVFVEFIKEYLGPDVKIDADFF